MPRQNVVVYSAYLENTSGNHNKCYVVAVHRVGGFCTVISAFGRIGAILTSNPETAHPTEHSGLTAAKKLVQSKLDKGYRVCVPNHHARLPAWYATVPSAPVPAASAKSKTVRVTKKDPFYSARLKNAPWRF